MLIDLDSGSRRLGRNDVHLCVQIPSGVYLITSFRFATAAAGGLNGVLMFRATICVVRKHVDNKPWFPVWSQFRRCAL